jgi:putative tricarboxylic transport membrane protein
VTARLIQQIAAEKRLFETPVAVINKPGGNHTIAWNHLNQHAGDAHYLLMVSLGLLTSSVTGANSIDPADATLISQLFTEYIVFAVQPGAQLRSGADVAARLRRDPAALTFATGGDGVGGANHLAAAQAMRAAGVAIRRLKVVPFNSSAQAATAVMGGHVDIVAAPAAAVLSHARAGRLRLIAISAPARSWGDLAAVPTWREIGVDAVFSNARAVVGPKGLGPDQIRYWEAVFSRLAQTEEWQKNLAANNRSPAYLDHAESQRAWRLLHDEIKTLWRELSAGQS